MSIGENYLFTINDDDLFEIATHLERIEILNFSETSKRLLGLVRERIFSPHVDNSKNRLFVAKSLMLPPDLYKLHVASWLGSFDPIERCKSLGYDNLQENRIENIFKKLPSFFEEVMKKEIGLEQILVPIINKVSLHELIQIIITQKRNASYKKYVEVSGKINDFILDFLKGINLDIQILGDQSVIEKSYKTNLDFLIEFPSEDNEANRAILANHFLITEGSLEYIEGQYKVLLEQITKPVIDALTLQVPQDRLEEAINSFKLLFEKSLQILFNELVTNQIIPLYVKTCTLEDLKNLIKMFMDKPTNEIHKKIESSFDDSFFDDQVLEISKRYDQIIGAKLLEWINESDVDAPD